MGVKLIQIINNETRTADSPKNVVAHLFASTKEDISDEMQVQGLPGNYELVAGSYVITAAGDIGLLDFDDTWHWVGEEDSTSAATLSMSRPNLLGGFNPTMDTDDAETVEEEISDEDDMR